jgi:hypothetical protein
VALFFLVRKLQRTRGQFKAESPPPSPLLNGFLTNAVTPFSPTVPTRIEMGMHQRMKSDENSEFWLSGKGSVVNEKEGDGFRYPRAISPLPSLKEEGGFNLFPEQREGEGKMMVPRSFQ